MSLPESLSGGSLLATARRPDNPCARMPSITLTLPEERFLSDIQRCASDVRVSANCNIPHPYPVDGARQWLERISRSVQNGEKFVFIVLLEGIFAGIVSLNAIDQQEGSAELDYWIAGYCQGFGVGTEAVRLAVLRAGQDLSLKSLFSSCLISNLASEKVLRRNAFHELGHFFNDGAFGRKFLNEEMIRFRRDLRPERVQITDYHIMTGKISVHPPGVRLRISRI